jgi:peptidyl-prolyl cis-trans isomerase B (cyclophilin B)
MANQPNPQIVMETSMGTIKVELFQDKAPITVQNILSYVDEMFYDGTIFHRVIPNFMIQGGGMQSGMKEKRTKAPIKNESTNGLANKRGTIAMARTSVPDSATAQFFINTVDNDFLDKAKAQDRVGYCVFGQVVDGMDVVDKIRKVPTGNVGGHGDVPKQEVAIKSVRRA